MKTKIKIKVKPNGQKFKIKGINEWTGELEIEIKSIPKKGQANKEIIQEIQKILGKKVEITKGKTSPNKEITIDAEKAEIEQKLKLIL